MYVEKVNGNKKLREMALNDRVGMHKNEKVVLVSGVEVLWLEVVVDSYLVCLKRIICCLLFFILFHPFFFSELER